MMTSRRAIPAAALLALVGTVACKDKGTEPPPTPSSVQRVSSAMLSGTVGQPLPEDLQVKVVSADGRAVPDVTVNWAVTRGNGTVSAATTTTDAEGLASVTWTLGTTAGSQQVSATVVTIDPVLFNATALADVADIVALDPSALTFAALQDTVAVAVTAEDAFGNALGDSGLTWSSLDEAVAAWVGSNRVASVGVGSTSIIVAIDDVADTLDVEVFQAIDQVTVTPDSVTLLEADTLTFVAVASDSNGIGLDPAPTIVWGTSDAAVTTVDTATGFVTAVAPGVATISAEATGTHNTVTGTAQAVVLSENAPVINSIAPDTMAPGDTITITGLNFAASPSADTVTIAGVVGTVLTASTTQLTVELPGRSDFVCEPVGPTTVTVRVAGMEGSTSHTLRVATPHTMALGESYRALEQDDVGCHEIIGSGDYVIGVFNTSSSVSSTSAFEVRGATPVSADPVLTVSPRPRPQRVRRSAPAPHQTEEADHIDVLEANRRLYEELGPPGMARRARSAGAVPLVNTASVGDTLNFSIPHLDSLSLCNSFVPVSGRVVYVGTRIVLAEDVNGPLAGTMDDVYESIGMEFDTLMYNVLFDYFGDPLNADDGLDDNDRIIAVFSEVVNNFDRSVAGFVFSGDFYDQLACASSDVAEIFYGKIATDSAGGSNDADTWRWRMRSTMIHEGKHLTAYANKIPSGGNLETSWLEESTARMSEELYARAIFGYGQGENVTYQESIYCEYRPSWAECMDLDPPVVMGKHFGGIYDWLETVEDLSPLRSSTDDRSSFYGSGWSLVRWAMDHSGHAENNFLHALIGEQTLTGVDNLVDKSGLGFTEMLVDWGMAWAVDDRGVTLDRSRLNHTGWDVRDIFEGLNGDFPNSYPMTFPLVPRALGNGAFVESVLSLRAGTGAYFDFTGSGGTQLIHVRGESDTALPATLRLAIVRVQ